MKIIIINGSGGVGKDSFVNFCIKHDGMVYSYSTIDCVKKIALEHCGWDGNKDEKGRKLLSDLKDALSNYNDLPYKDVIDKINLLVYECSQFDIETEHLIVFIHCREPKEIDKFKKRLHARTLLIRRPEEENKFNNHADSEVFNYDYDYVYNNDRDLDFLKENAEQFIDFTRSLKWYSYGKELREPWDFDSYRRENKE